MEIEQKKVTRLLRHRVSGAYFNGKGWTHNAAQAKPFSDVLEAARVCADHGLVDVELALRMSPGTSDLFCIPMR